MRHFHVTVKCPHCGNDTLFTVWAIFDKPKPCPHCGKEIKYEDV